MFSKTSDFILSGYIRIVCLLHVCFYMMILHSLFLETATERGPTRVFLFFSRLFYFKLKDSTANLHISHLAWLNFIRLLYNLKSAKL